MTLSEKDINLIDQYLKAKLTGSDLEEFKRRLETDKEFDDEVHLMSVIVKGIRSAGRKELKSQISAIDFDTVDSGKKKISIGRISSIAASIILLIGLGGWFLWQKNTRVQNITQKINDTASPYSPVVIPDYVYNVSDSKNLIKLEGGESLLIPSKTFTDDKGLVLKSKVKIRYKNLTGALDQFLEGIPTAIDAGSSVKILNAGSLFSIAFLASRNTPVNASKPLQVIIPTRDTARLNQIFRLDSIHKKWIACGKDTIINIAKYNVAEIKPDIWIPRLEDVTKPRFKIMIDEKRFPELAHYKNFIFEIADEERNYDPNDAQLIWKSIVVEKGEKGKPYKITFTNDVKTVSYMAVPVFSKEEYAKALKIYNDKIKNTALQKFGSRELNYYELAKLIKTEKGNTSNYFRIFSIASPGIYANSNLMELSTNRNFKVEFTDTAGVVLPLSQLAIADFSKNTLQRFIIRDKVHLQFDNASEKAILAITTNNQFAYITETEFRNTFDNTNPTAIKLHVLKEINDYSRLKSIFNSTEIGLIENFLKKSMF